ncbi:acylaminoacyl-peptidase [Gillisia sp. Hel_I_86]|uniref:S9 family peptidase n=1 Tax=Gillisia sp. Hel_I_86 TaxID=1249981 RepID=UPI0011996EE7|nr:S9 family peptidase [Gillisia sp. Hel_I_86]TVZ27702.1 acylaminoacyl-peptidase [Gillisia sp. Hel_I_86]
MKKLTFLFLLTSQLLVAQQSDKLELLDIFNLEYISDPQISPDGKQVVYVRNFKDVMTDKNLSNLWIVNFDGTQNRPLTTGNTLDNYPRWSPDGKKLLFKSNRDGEMRLYLMWLDSKQPLVLSNSNDLPGAISWSPDSKFIAFSKFVTKENASPIKMPKKPEGAKWNEAPKYITDMNYRADGAGYLKSGNTQLFIVSIDGHTPRQLTFTGFDHGAPIWGKDGKNLYFSANLKEDHELDPMNSEIHKLNITDGKITMLTERQGPDSDPIISTDGKKIAYLGFDDRLQGYQLSQLYIMNTDGSGSKNISEEFDRDISDISWDKNSNGLYFQYNDKGNTKLGYISTSGKVKGITKDMGGLSLGRPYNAASYSIAENGNYAFTSGKNAMLSDLGVGNNGNDRVLTDVNSDLLSFKKLGKVEEIWWKSSVDKRDIQGWIVTPPDFDPNKKYPMILEIHGGPFASYGNVFSAEIQLMAAAGYVVLYTNPRGSTGYGEEFGNLIHHDYPNNDYHDLMSGVDAVLEKGYIDKENLFVTGGSGGGVLTAWIVGKTERFKAAVVAKPVINWTSFVLYADNPGFFAKYWFGKKPWEDPESYFKRSPLNYVANITTPTMLLTGEEDYRTPIAESEQFYSALKLEGVETAMVRIPGSGHGIANRPSNLVAKVAAILSWFEKYKDN